jgi:hypothetical protein
MAKGASRARGRKRAGRRFMGIEVDALTPRQKDLLKEIFHLGTVAVLGLAPGGSYTNQMPIRKRPPPRR